MTDFPHASLTHLISFDDDLPMVCTDPASGQSLRFATVDGREVVTYSYSADGAISEVVLREEEAAELNAWRNSGRRTSYWDWPGWKTVRQRGKPASIA